MPKFDIPIIATVEARNITEARQLVYKAAEVINDGVDIENDAMNKLLDKAFSGIELNMADDSETDNYNQRMVFLHPDDVDVNYDIEAYNAALDKDNEE